MRNKVLYYATKYNGDYNKIMHAIKFKESYKKINSVTKYVTIFDTNYPNKLKTLKKPPLILFYKGDINLLNQDSIGVIGSRKISSYGQRYTKIVVAHLKKDFVIVSGLAAGVDACAHREAIVNGKSIAVLGSGINYVYPKSNTDLYNLMKTDNLIISEYPDMVQPKPYFFPFRNRIIAALSKSIVVTQASMQSGTMLTVNEGLELNKSIYVLPYRIDDLDGTGCNYLIQQGANVLLIDEIADLCNNI